MVDIETSSKLKDLLSRTHAAIPKIIDQANDSGDYSQIERANQVMDRLGAMADHHVFHINNAMQQDQQGGSMPQPQDVPSATAAQGSNLPELDNQGLQQKTPQQQLVHEAAKGAVKGAAEAQQPPPQTPYGQPGFPARGKSALPDFGGDNADKAINQAYRIDKNGYDAEIETALEQARKIGKPAEPESALPQPQKPNAAGAALDDILATAGEPAPLAASNLPEPQGEQDQPASQSDGPSPDIEAAAPQLEKEYAANPRKLVQDFAQSPGMSDYDREFAHRVAVELGKRPQLATVPKILAALSLGVGSALGAWISGKYTGGALIDLSEDQKHYDRQRGEIGREVYGANKREENTSLLQQAMAGRQAAKDQGTTSRLETKESGLDRRQLVGEAGKDARQTKKEAGLDKRQAAALDARLKQIMSKQQSVRMSPDDTTEVSKLKMQYNALAHDHSSFVVDDKTFNAKSRELLDGIDAIIAKYRK